ncbi:hypothetical protein Tco_0884689 [Tanacetum coccineum]
MKIPDANMRLGRGCVFFFSLLVRSGRDQHLSARHIYTLSLKSIAAHSEAGSHELYVHHEDAQDDRALLRAQISLLMIEMRYFRFMSLSYEREAVYARQAWSRLEDMSTTLEALIRAHETRITTLEAQIRALHKDVSVLQKQRINDGDKLTMHIQHEHDKYRELEHTRDAERQDGPANAGSSCWCCIMC